MLYPFDETFRSLVARRCAAFPRTPALDAARGLRRAAVAVILVESEDGTGETAFVLTRRRSDLRAHKGQYALPGGRCEEGENAVAAALREVQEELGLGLNADHEGLVLRQHVQKVSFSQNHARVRVGQHEPQSLHRM